MSGQKSPARYAAYTGVTLALCVLFQSLRSLLPGLSAFVIMGPFDLSVLLVGTLVNLTLIFSSWFIGFWSGAAISLLAPLIAFLQGFQRVIAMVPVIILGNLTIVAISWILRKRRVAGALLGAGGKFAAQYLLVAFLVVPVFVTQEAQRVSLPLLFSWPQFITAVLGGLLALLLTPRLEKALR
ncbi:MAG: hypothetical protein LBH86_02785 [Oscillospiraceae bacterium]|jgi:hypothetical protein|nr:hypothetical protein [Oscillospiraceae bacterium]